MKEKAFSEALLVRYLLGDLPEEEQVKVEDRAFQDRECMQDILAVESDLIDEYVRGELSDSTRRQFESRFLASAERRRKVEFAKALTAVAPEFAVRSGGPRPKLVIPQTAQRVRIQIEIEPGNQYKRFRVELRGQAGQQVWTEDNLSARRLRAGRAVVLNLPASKLVAGQYELALKGVIDDGRTEDIGYYYFDVMKK